MASKISRAFKAIENLLLLGFIWLVFWLIIEYEPVISDWLATAMNKFYIKLYKNLEPIGIDLSRKAAAKLVKENPVQDTLWLFALGLLFYRFKKYQQFWYGVFETAFAIVYGYLQFKNIQKDALSGAVNFTVLLTVLAVVYLTVRGVSNMDDGGKKEYWNKNLIHPAYLSIREFASDLVRFENT